MPQPPTDPKELRRLRDELIGFVNWGEQVFFPLQQEHRPKYLKMVYDAYPHFVRHAADEHIAKYLDGVTVFSIHNHGIVFYDLYKKYLKNHDLTQEYGADKLASWREFYFAAREPHQITDAERDTYGLYSNEEWQAFMQRENTIFTIQFHYKEWQRKIYMDCFHPLLLQLYPLIPDFEGDYWLMYAKHLEDCYSELDSYLGRLDFLLDTHMPTQHINLPNAEWVKERSKISIKQLDQSTYNAQGRYWAFHNRK